MIAIDGSSIHDFDSFHSVFAEAFGFPDFYGQNMSAWIDCMTSIDSPEDGMSTVHGTANDPVVIHIEDAASIPKSVIDALNDCAAFVNWRRLESGMPAILAVAYGK